MKSGKILVGILAGAVGGALLGILFSPEKGSRLRRNIKYKSEDYADELKDKFNDFVDSIPSSYKKVWRDAEMLFDEGKAKNRLDTSKKEIA
ncbi:MAG: YtxH domain-containing protein [Flavobacterium sp.]